MKRIGKYTGYIYDESVDPRIIKECAHLVTREEAEDANYRKKLRSRDAIDCQNCHGCPMSRNDDANKENK